ncbi:MAG: chorismate lyase [Francisellaceae bacterium]|jgi:chorismate-pyruvate lyase|nr:chorismate lyase [Francisellaceae bacterium]MBT6207400.1 chorismate lyase [Francisellaceae bacterium]MBT6539095.1 chorismate lyase [Francisellaceae bacterium]
MLSSKWSDSIHTENGDDFDIQWLLKPYNVTAALKEHYDTIELELLSQQEQALSIYEQTHITQKTALVREIYLKHDHDALTYGRVIFSNHAYETLKDRIDTLGTKPIGQHLFYKHKFNRSNFKYARLDTKNVLLMNACRRLNDGLLEKIEYAYSRHSIFSPPNDSNCLISLHEVFFPWLKKYIA